MLSRCLLLVVIACAILCGAEDDSSASVEDVSRHGGDHDADKTKPANVPVDAHTPHKSAKGADLNRIPFPENVIPLMPKVPMIPKDYRLVVENVFHVTINYSYFWDYDKDPNGTYVTLTTKEQMQKARANPLSKATEQTPSEYFYDTLPTMLLTLIFAYIYKYLVTDKRPSFPAAASLNAAVSMESPPHDFHAGFFDCCADKKMCCVACFCPAIRAADTYSVSGVMDFWIVMALWLGIKVGCALLHFVMPDSWGYNSDLATALLFGLAFLRPREALRGRLGAPPRAQSRAALDFLSWAFCSCCAVVQEGREVDMVQGVEVKFLATGIEQRGVPLVGDPVATSS